MDRVRRLILIVTRMRMRMMKDRGMEMGLEEGECG